MIDCHIHTKRCHHGKGDLEDFVAQAIKIGLKVIGFSEHAPFLFDHNNRMNEAESLQYLTDVKDLKKRYAGRIKILAGLEMDYLPEAEGFIKKLISQIDCDYVFGGVHFLSSGINIWDFENLQNEHVWKQYFDIMHRAVASGFFNGIVHPDLILRAGVPSNRIKQYLMTVVQEFKKHGISYEVNCGGITKNSYNPETKQMVDGIRTYPDMDVVRFAHQQQVRLTIGSDGHSPDMLGKNIEGTINELRKNGVGELFYFENKTPVLFKI